MEATESVTAPKKNLFYDIYDILELLVICAVAVVLLYTFGIRMTVVQQHSMEQTLNEGEYTLVSDLFYTPKTGDIVVVQNVALKGHHEPLIKRVIAVGGDTLNVNYKTWTITITHEGKTEILDQSDFMYLAPNRILTSNWYDQMEADGSYTYFIPENYLFVMGDNRNVSADSRLADVGLFHESCVVGHVFLRALPLSKFTFFK